MIVIFLLAQEIIHHHHHKGLFRNLFVDQLVWLRKCQHYKKDGKRIVS